MKIASKLTLVFLPLIALSVITAAVFAFAGAARSVEFNITGTLSAMAAELEDYAYEQEALLFEEGLANDTAMIDVVIAAIESRAKSLVRNSNQIIFALDFGNHSVFFAGNEKYASGIVFPSVLVKKYFVRSFKLDIFQLTVYVAQDRLSVISALNTLIFVSIILLIVLLVISAIVIRIVSRTITKPVSEIKKAFDAFDFAKIKEQVEINPVFDDEIGAFAISYNSFMKKIKEAQNDLIAKAKGSDAKKKIEEKRRNIFQLYAPNEIVKKVLKSSSELLSGQKCEAAVLFSGARHLSPLSDNLPPAKFLDLLNRYFLRMTSIASKKGGVNFNIEGDSLLSGWGVPSPKKRDAGHALHSALLMIEAVQKINEENDNLGLPPLEIGVGLDAGFVTAGNIASSNKVDWAVMGSPVTTAVQLQELTKKYHEAVLFTENIYKKVYAFFPCRFVDKIATKGQAAGVSLFTARLKITGAEKDAWKHHRIGVKLFYARKFSEAQLQFEQALMSNPQDTLSSIYIKRCGKYIKSPPPAMWDGSINYVN